MVDLAWGLSMTAKVSTMSDVPPACRIYTRYLIEEWLRCVTVPFIKQKFSARVVGECSEFSLFFCIILFCFCRNVSNPFFGEFSSDFDNDLAPAR